MPHPLPATVRRRPGLRARWAVLGLGLGLGLALVASLAAGLLNPDGREPGIDAALGVSVVDDDGRWRTVDARRGDAREGLARLAVAQPPAPPPPPLTARAETADVSRPPDTGEAAPIADLAEMRAADDAAMSRIAETLEQTVVAAGPSVEPVASDPIEPSAAPAPAPAPGSEPAPDAASAAPDPAPAPAIPAAEPPRLAQAGPPPQPHLPPPPRPAATAEPSVARIIAPPPLPEPRHVAVARAIPPPDGFATPASAVGATARQAAGGATWTRHARPFDAADPRPRIALVVTDLGLTQGITDQAIHYLPGAITLAFSPFADNLPNWVEQARRAGHEVLINLPPDTGGVAREPQGLMLQAGAIQPAAEAAGRLEWVLNRSSGHVGVASFLGPTGDDQVLRPILAVLRERGFIFVGRQGGARAPSARLAQELGVPHAAIDRQIDADPAREAIEQRLVELERIARETGTAVALLRPHAASFERLAIWHTSLDAKGIALAPITAVLNRQRNR